MNATADSTAIDIISSSAAVENVKDTTRKFIRIADLKFRTESVIKSTYDIEETVNRQGGFVSFTKLISEIDSYTSVAVSVDSSLEKTYYTVTNSMTIRVPNTRLDSTLKEISKNILYLDYRAIKADDVALQIHSNNLTQIRSTNSNNRLKNAIDHLPKKLNETTMAVDVLLRKEEQKDNASISNLSLNVQINLSTINLSIYQRQIIKSEVVLSEKIIDAYEPSFGSKIMEALRDGWKLLESFLVFITRIWAIFFVSIFAYFAYQAYRRKFK